MSAFDGFLVPREFAELFDAPAIAQAMFDFEAALARAQAAEGLIPAAAAQAIAGLCRAELHDLPALVAASGRAGSLAIPLVAELKKTVALFDPAAAGFVHHGSTSQDAIDTALALATKRALALIDVDLDRLGEALLVLAEAHAATPLLARTLMQPAAVTSFGLKAANWLAPLVRARLRLREAAARGLALQLGGAVGTLDAMDGRGSAVARRMATSLGLALPPAPWHTQRDDWVRLGLEAAVLTGSLGKIATDLALMAQGEVAEVAEPAAPGRGGSTAMPHKRNPVAALTALAAAQRVPQRAAAVLAAMPQQHERGLGTWQAELAEWPGLFAGAGAAARALAEAMAGLEVDEARMRRNLVEVGGAAFAEALQPDTAVAPAAALARARVTELRVTLAAMPAAPWSAALAA